MIRVFIPSYKCVEINGRNKRYHTYQIQIQHNDNSVTYLDRRYSDFLILHKEIRQKFGGATPFFPPKKVRNNSLKVLNTRKLELQSYLQTILLFSPLPKEVLAFLNLHPHYQYQRNQRCEEKVFYNSLEDSFNSHADSAILNQPAAGFVEDPYIESDTSSNISDTVTRGVLDALYNV